MIALDPHATFLVTLDGEQDVSFECRHLTAREFCAFTKKLESADGADNETALNAIVDACCMVVRRIYGVDKLPHELADILTASQLWDLASSLVRGMKLDEMSRKKSASPLRFEIPSTSGDATASHAPVLTIKDSGSNAQCVTATIPSARRVPASDK